MHSNRIESILLIIIACTLPIQFSISIGSVRVNASYADPVIALVLFLVILGIIILPRLDILFAITGIFILVIGIGIIPKLIQNPSYFALMSTSITLIKMSFSIAWMFVLYVLTVRNPYRNIWIFTLVTAVIAGVSGLRSILLRIFIDASRSSAGFINPNIFAYYLTLSIFLTLSWLYWMYDTDTFDRNAAAILVLSTGISLTALIGTASRASILGLAVGIISAATVNKNARHTLSNLRALAGPILSVIIAIIFEYINNFKLTGRFISAVQQGAFGYRLKSWSVSLQGLIEYPVFGIGLGQHISYIGASRGITPHNTFILIASGTGLLGIFVLIWFGIMLLRRSILIITDYETHYLSLYIGFFISSAIFALFHDINNFRSFWVATGLLTASVCGRDQLDIH